MVGVMEREKSPSSSNTGVKKSLFYLPGMICKPENILSTYDVLILLLVCEISEPFLQASYFRAFFFIFPFGDLQLGSFVYLDRLVWDSKIHGHKYNWMPEAGDWKNEVSAAYFMGLPLLKAQSRIIISSWKEKVTSISHMPTASFVLVRLNTRYMW